jgi:Tol biopolymer transport system component
MINTSSLEVTPALSRDGHYLFFVSPRLTGLADIFVSYREYVHDDLAWQPPVMLGPEINTSFGDTAPAFFENDDYGRPQLYFNSNRPGGMGLMDIYMTEMRADGTMSPAVLVPELSSAYNDVTPDISRDGLQMFFQSTRPGGSGETDLWASMRSSVLAPWPLPENMGATVNSSAVESGPSISSDGKTLYFASNRAGGGGFDIYMVTRTAP